MPPPLATQEVAEEMGFKPQEWIGDYLLLSTSTAPFGVTI